MATASDQAQEAAPAEDASALPVRVIGMPGDFAALGLAWVCQILEHAGQQPQVVALAEAAPGWRVGFGHVPRAEPFAGRTIVVLDTLASVLAALLRQRGDALVAVQELTGFLAPLADVLRGPGVLIVRREPNMDVAATRAAIAAHLLPGTPPPEAALPCEAGFDPAAPEPVLIGQPLALLRQVLEPMLAFAQGAREPIVWPLCCFYSGDRMGELAPPIVETSGPARILYYGPYFHLPAGRWQVDVQLFFSNDVPDSLLAAEIYTQHKLTEATLHPRQAGLFEAGMTASVPRPDEWVDFHLCTRFGAFSGQLGMRQVTLTPLDEELDQE